MMGMFIVQITKIQGGKDIRLMDRRPSAMNIIGFINAIPKSRFPSVIKSTQAVIKLQSSMHLGQAEVGHFGVLNG